MTLLPAIVLLFALPIGQSGPDDFRISMDVNLVVLGVTVRDPSGGFVSGLHKENFHIFDNGKPQQPKLFLAEDVPVTVGLVVDGSGSMGPKRAQTIEAALAFAHFSNPEDEMFVVHFNERVFLGLPESDSFTSDNDKLRSALVRSPGAGKTALYDAIAVGLDQLQQGTRNKKVLIVFSDGGDNSSTHTLQEILQRAEKSNVIIYTIGLFDEQDQDRNPRVLKRLASITGGEVYLPHEDGNVMDVCKRIAHDIRNQYTLAYVPEASGGSLRAIKVTVSAPDHRKLLVRTRTGYIPPAAPANAP